MNKSKKQDDGVFRAITDTGLRTCGLVVVKGPHGSGKTTLLRTFYEELRQPAVLAKGVDSRALHVLLGSHPGVRIVLVDDLLESPSPRFDEATYVVSYTGTRKDVEHDADVVLALKVGRAGCSDTVRIEKNRHGGVETHCLRRVGGFFEVTLV